MSLVFRGIVCGMRNRVELVESANICTLKWASDLMKGVNDELSIDMVASLNKSIAEILVSARNIQANVDTMKHIINADLISFPSLVPLQQSISVLVDEIQLSIKSMENRSQIED